MISKRVSLFIFAISLILSMTMLTSAITGKIGNARAVLYPEVESGGTSIDRTILVINDNDVEVNVSLQAAEGSSLIEIIDKNFVLQPGEQREARFKINLKKAGDYEQRINVLFAPFTGKGAGIALSSTIIIHAKGVSDDSDVVDNSDNGDSVTGNIVGLGDFVSNKDNRGMIIASVSTLVLLALLIVLLILSKKKTNEEKKDVKRKTIKRRDRSS